MSRIGKLPIEIPEGVQVEMQENKIEITGPKGSQTVFKHPKINYTQQDNTISLTKVDKSAEAKRQYGLRRTLLNNALVGVSKGFEKGLELVGVGYKVSVVDKKVTLNVGYSHPKEYHLPQDIEARVEGSRLFISGMDKQEVGEVAAEIRKIGKPEPYKGKGIKYIDEELLRKAGKSGKK